MIIRSPRPESNWYQLDKRISEDKRLSWAARGLLIYLLGKPDNWRIMPSALVNEVADSRIPTKRDGTYALLEELIGAGYIKRVQERVAHGFLGNMEYHVSEQPLPAQPYPAQPYPAETTLVNTDKAVSNETPAKATDEEILKEQLACMSAFLEFWQAYPKKVAKPAAEKAWRTLKPSATLRATILQSLESFKASEQWKRDNGQFVPNPASWLNARRWEDEGMQGQPKKSRFAGAK